MKQKQNQAASSQSRVFDDWNGRWAHFYLMLEALWATDARAARRELVALQT
jgi:hypothetical protein